MVNILRSLTSYLSVQEPLQQLQHEIRPHKSVAIVGAGSAGLGMLKTLLELPDAMRDGWEFSLFEERDNVGGIWLPEQHPVSPPHIPETPLYPRLHTNTPVPFMTYPGFPFPAGTPLYPNHTHIQAYHSRYAHHHKLFDHIHLKHGIQSASWTGTSERGYWNLTIANKERGIEHRAFGHLIVGSGNNKIPRYVSWSGQDLWLKHGSDNRPRRTIVHSVYYREPEAFANQRVLVIGNGASGRDIATQVLGVAAATYVSQRHDSMIPWDPPEGLYIMSEISHFTADGVVCADGVLLDVDTVVLATGYELSKPFLEAGGILRVDRSASDNTSAGEGLVTNLRYIFPLFKHILSLSAELPVNALAFIGLPTFIANCPSDVAQSLLVAHAIVQPHLLPSRLELLEDLARQEHESREYGVDPYVRGHRMYNGTRSNDYQDEIVEFLQDKGVIPNTGRKFVEQWRRDTFTYECLKRGWNRIEELGEGEKWTKDVETEEQWAHLMWRINEWQCKWEEANDMVFGKDIEALDHWTFLSY